MTHSQITSFLWSIADLIRDTFKRGKYQDVILPLTVLRRIDQVLEPTKQKVLKTYSEYKGKLDNPDDLLRKASGYAFYNTSLYTFERLVDDPQNIAHNLRTYIQSFSPNMREVIEKFDFDNTITKLDDAGLLFQVMERFAQVDLHPDRVSNPMMGTIFEELIRKFNEALDENPGEHLTPRDVVHLMVRPKRGSCGSHRSLLDCVTDFAFASSLRSIDMRPNRCVRKQAKSGAYWSWTNFGARLLRVSPTHAGI